MTHEVTLPIGPFKAHGQVSRTIALSAVKLAERRTEGAQVIWHLGARAKLYVVRTLYRLEPEGTFAVHAVLVSGKNQCPQLARLEIYPHWEELIIRHPDLGRDAAHLVHASRDGAHPGRATDAASHA